VRRFGTAIAVTIQPFQSPVVFARRRADSMSDLQLPGTFQ
jgi:hypothetical protein